MELQECVTFKQPGRHGTSSGNSAIILMLPSTFDLPQAETKSEDGSGVSQQDHRAGLVCVL